MSLIKRVGGRRNIVAGEWLYHATHNEGDFVLRQWAPWWDGAPMFLSTSEVASAFGEMRGEHYFVELLAERALPLWGVPVADFPVWAKRNGLQGLGGEPAGLAELTHQDWRRLQEGAARDVDGVEALLHNKYQGIRVYGAFAEDGSGYERGWGDGDEIALWNTDGLTVTHVEER